MGASLKTLLAYLKENNDVTFTKYKLWKALHSIGFRYGKVDQKSMGHLERVLATELVNDCHLRFWSEYAPSKTN